MFSFIPFCFWSSLTIHILLNSFNTLRLLMTVGWALWASILFSHANTWWLDTCVFLSALKSSLIIYTNISLSLSLCMNLPSMVYLFLCNCIFSHYSISAHYSSTFLFTWLTSLWNSNNSIVSLYFGVNLLLSVSKRPSEVVGLVCIASLW